MVLTDSFYAGYYLKLVFLIKIYAAAKCSIAANRYQAIYAELLQVIVSYLTSMACAEALASGGLDYRSAGLDYIRNGA